jgi:predicted MFS family arabinose efflux permease
LDISIERGWDRRTWAVVFSGFCAFLGLYATQPLLPLLERYFSVGKVAVSLTVTATTAGVALAAPLIGTIADRFGRKRVIVGSACLLALATLLDATATGLPSLIFWRFLQGVFTPGVFAVTVAYIQEEWADSGAGRATAAYVTGTIIGGFTGRMTAGLIASRADWHLVFVALGLASGVAAVVLQAWLPRERRFIRDAEGFSPLGSAIDHLRNKRLLAIFAVGFCVLFSLLGTFTYVTFYLAAPPFHLSPAAIGSLFVVYLVGAVITPPCGRAIDRYGHRIALAVAIGVAMLGELLTLSHSLWAVVIGLAAVCSGVFVAQAAANSHIGLAAEHSKALAVGLYVTFYYVGGSVGAALPGYVWALGGWPACVGVFVLMQLTIVAIALAAWGAPSDAAPRDAYSGVRPD